MFICVFHLLYKLPIQDATVLMLCSDQQYPGMKKNAVVMMKDQTVATQRCKICELQKLDFFWHMRRPQIHRSVT